MKKIGTFSSAAGLIFLGTWMIISRINPELGREVFKWWPAVIIVLGIEVLLQFTSRSEERVKINYLIIPVLLILLFVNIFQGISGTFRNLFNNIEYSNGPVINISGINLNKYRHLDIEKALPVYGSKLYLNADNARINIIRTNDKAIKISGKVYIDKNNNTNKYDIIEKKEADGYILDIKEIFIKAVELDVEIPYGYNYKIDSNNLDLRGKDKDMESIGEVTGGNINVKLNGLKSLALDFNNGNVNLQDILEIKAKSSNSNIEIDGDTQNIDVDSSLGRVDVRNSICKTVNIVLRQGVVNLDTRDENVTVNVELGQGVADINNEKTINSGASRTFGTGAGRVSIKMNQGAIRFNN